MLLNPQHTAAQAAEAGIITRVVADDELETAAAALTAQLAAGSLAAHGSVKRLLDASATATFEDQLALESSTIAAMAAGPEGREGVTSFLERRKPDFPGAA
jgi:2-(1,2-epoxy-1,2-dihydrophenyl)acetyl-CoA isomerase